MGTQPSAYSRDEGLKEMVGTQSSFVCLSETVGTQPSADSRRKAEAATVGTQPSADSRRDDGGGKAEAASRDEMMTMGWRGGKKG